MILTETWLNETDIFPENFLSPKHKFYSKSRSSKTGVNKGGGVAIWVPRDISSKRRNDLNVLNESFFESLWVEISGLSVSKNLINASYCPNKNLRNNFIDELTSETSSAYSITDEVLLFGYYNLNHFNKRESTLLDELASNSGLVKHRKTNTSHQRRRNTNRSRVLQQQPNSRCSDFPPHQLKCIT